MRQLNNNVVTRVPFSTVYALFILNRVCWGKKLDKYRYITTGKNRNL